MILGVVYYGDVDHPVPGQIDHWVSWLLGCSKCYKSMYKNSYL